MAKGATCPFCQDQKWLKKKKGLRRCSNCGTIGWLGDEKPSGGGGQGLKCPHCERKTLVKLGTFKKAEVRRCTSCELLAIRPPD